MFERNIPGSIYDSETRNRVLDVATELFALKGFAAVSMRDISNAVGIQMSSIYYHYKSKSALTEDVLERFESGYRHYFDLLSAANEEADSLEALMDNMFNREFLEMENPIGCLGMALAIKEQHNSELARRLVFELFYKDSIRIMEASFDRFIEKEAVPPHYTKMIAMIFMFCVMIGNDIRVHEYAGIKTPIDCTEMYGELRKYITLALKSEKVDTDNPDQN